MSEQNKFNKDMTRVCIVSPFSGEVERNKDYLSRAIRDSIDRGEAPFAPHAIYPEVLNDEIPKERQLGMSLGHKFMAVCDKVYVYADYKVSDGMCDDIAYATSLGMEVHFRYIGENPENIVTFTGSMSDHLRQTSEGVSISLNKYTYPIHFMSEEEVARRITPDTTA